MPSKQHLREGWERGGRGVGERRRGEERGGAGARGENGRNVQMAEEAKWGNQRK